MPDVTTLAPENGNDIILARLYDAPRQMVWDALVDPEALALWWAPDGCTIETRSADIRPGGIWDFLLKTPEGTVFENRHKYETLQATDCIVYRQGDRPEDDNAVRVTITLAAHGDATLLTLRIEFSSNQWRQDLIPRGAIRYPAQSLSHLETYLKSKTGSGA